MSVNSKHLTTFVLGAAAGIALHTYAKTDEGKKLLNQIKSKGNKLRDDAKSKISKAPEYFESLKTEASSSMSELVAKIKEKFPEDENIIADLFSKKTGNINIDDTKTP
jgi:lambda repressor-like predicted transcriptional regulator